MRFRNVSETNNFTSRVQTFVQNSFVKDKIGDFFFALPVEFKEHENNVKKARFDRYGTRGWKHPVRGEITSYNRVQRRTSYKSSSAITLCSLRCAIDVVAKCEESGFRERCKATRFLDRRGESS